MKKKFLIVSTILGILSTVGFSMVANASIATVSAGEAQTITLPTSTVTLTGTATAVAPQVIASYSWAQTSGPVASVIATPTTASTLVSGLTTAGSYVFTLTVSDDSAVPVTGTSTVTITVKPVSSPVVKTPKMKLEINPNGKVNMQGSIQSITGSIIVVKVWGITFNVNTANSKFDSKVKDISLYKAGDYVSVKGIIVQDASTPTINAYLLKNYNIQTLKELSDRENEKKSNNDDDKDDDKNNNKGKRNRPWWKIW